MVTMKSQHSTRGSISEKIFEWRVMNQVSLYKDPHFIRKSVHVVNTTLVFVLFYDFWFSQLGPNPPEKLIHVTGWWALALILLTLSITPLVKFLKFNAFGLSRKTFGMWGFSFATFHLLLYLFFDKSLDWKSIFQDIAKRPFILLGFVAWLMLVPLALTSRQSSIKQLGLKNWKKIHKTIYILSAIALVHFYLMKKSNHIEPYIFAFLWMVLMLIRLKLNTSKGSKTRDATKRRPA